MTETIFSKIIRKEIPAKIVYETDTILAFHDIHPKAPIHILIIPKIEIPSVRELASREHAFLLGDLFDAANKIAEIFGVKEKGFRLIFNCGPDGGQEVYHLHMHLLAGKKLGF
ncbi:MAG: histidine triad nucleotide-binding protein [Ignavibacteria bacterium]|nr:histidine triad nucleotide-binding protein [Ignavibacteria bacterium]